MLNIRRGLTLIEITIVIAIMLILTAIALPLQLRARINASQEAARNILKIISSACETYANTHNGAFPTAVTDLTTPIPPYLNTNYCAGTYNFYTFDCTGMIASGYTIVANPTIAGAGVHSITTGGQITPPD